MDGVWHKRSWGGHARTSSPCSAWPRASLIERGLKGVRLVVGDRCAGLVKLDAAQGEIPAVHGAFHAQRALEDAADTPRMGVRRPQGHIRHGIPGIRPGQGRTGRHGDGIQELKAAANCLREGVGETTTYLLDEFPDGAGIRTNNTIERLNREIRRRTRVVGGFPTGTARCHMRPHPSRHRERMVDPPLSRHVPAR